MEDHDIFRSIKEKTYTKIKNNYKFEADVYKTPENYQIIVKDRSKYIFILTLSYKDKITKFSEDFKKLGFKKIIKLKKCEIDNIDNILETIGKTLFLEDYKTLKKYFSKHMALSHSNDVIRINFNKDGVNFDFDFKNNKDEIGPRDFDPDFMTLMQSLNNFSEIFYIENDKIVLIHSIPIDINLTMHEMLEIKEINL